MGMDLSPGDLLGGFRLVRPTGTGGFAEVWLAEDANGARVALKVLAPAHGGTTALHREWFRREYEVGQSVRSRYVATPFTADLDAEPMWMALPFVEGRTLRQVLAAGPLDSPTVRRIASQMAQGLADIHAHGLVHRDIKPSNVMISPGDHVTILDLGIVHDPEWTSLTGPLQPGTMGYLAPESTGSSVTSAVDVWAFSVVLVQMLNPDSRTDDPLEVSLVGVDPGWAALVRACQAMDPLERPDAGALVAWIDSGPDAAFDPDSGRPAGSPTAPGGQAPGGVDAGGPSSTPPVPPVLPVLPVLPVPASGQQDPRPRPDDPGSDASPPQGSRPRGPWALAVALVVLVVALLALALAWGLGRSSGDPGTPAPPSTSTDAGVPSAEPSTADQGTTAPQTTTRSPARPTTRPPTTRPTESPTPSTPTPTDPPTTGPPTDPPTTAPPTDPPTTEPPTDRPTTAPPTVTTNGTSTTTDSGSGTGALTEQISAAAL